MKNLKSKIILAIIFLAIAAGIFGAGRYFKVDEAQAAGVTYYVCYDASECNTAGSFGWSTGKDANSGLSKSSPFLNIQKAADMVNAGDVVIVGSGTYADTNADKYIIKLTKTGNSANWITFKSEHPGGAVIDGENTLGLYGILLIEGVSYIRLEGFIIKNCDNGIFANPPETAPNTNIYVYQCQIFNIARKIFHDSYGRAGIFTGSYSRNFTVDSCAIHDVGRLPGGNYPDGNDYHDYVHDHGFYAQGAGHLIKNSIFYNAYAGWNIKIDGYLGEIPATESSIKIINSVFAHAANPFNDPTIAYHGGLITIYVNPTGYAGLPQNRAKNVVIENSIFYNPPAPIYGGVSRPNFAIQTYNLWTTAVFSDTLIRNCVTNGQSLIKMPDGYSVSDLKTYSNNHDAATDQTLNDSDLGMIDPENDNFALLSNANYLINKGYSGLGVLATDILNNPRDSFPDIGAYEYSGDNTTPPSVPAGLSVK